MNKQLHEQSPGNKGEHVTSSLLRYRLILLLLFPLLVMYTLLQAVKFRSLRYALQRAGICPATPQVVDIWIHAASVGEVFAALPLIKRINDHYPDKQLLVTTTTPTGAGILHRQTFANVRHCFLPIDLAFAVSSFLAKSNPKCAIIMETEIWPNLFRLCHARNIPLVTVNGRLSARTLDARPWVKTLLRTALGYSSLILTRSDNDTKGFIALGADPGKVKTVGNIKFSADFTAPAKNDIDLTRPYVLAASTHDNEELQIATMWRNMCEKIAGHLLVIAPRHPNRLQQILKQLQPLNLSIAVRSRNDTIGNKTDIYIVDTLGELVDFMYKARLIFMGGSLVMKGGHNIIEPANLGKAIVFGPYMNNFEDEAQLLLNHGAAIQVEDIRQLQATLIDLLDDPETADALGNRARQLMESQKDMADRYVAELQPYLE